MNTKDVLKNLRAAGVLVNDDANGAHHFRFLPINLMRCANFTKFQQRALEMPLGDSKNFAASLVAFDLIPVSALLSENFKCAKYLLGPDGLTLHFALQDGSHDVRLLSKVTTTRLHGACVDVREALVQFGETLDLNELELDALAWASRNLPMSVFAHVARLTSMEPASVNSLIRQRTRLAIVGEHSGEQNFSPVLVAEILDQALQSDAKLQNFASMKNVLTCLSGNPLETRQQTLRRWVKGLLLLRPQVEADGGHAGVVFAWILDLIESGTQYKGAESDLATRVRYCKAAAVQICKALVAQGKPASALTGKEWSAVLHSVLADPSATDRRALSAAVGDFTHFLEENFHFEHINVKRDGYLAPIKPRNELVYEHEVQLASKWVVGSNLDLGTKLRLTGALAMGYAAPFRLSELLHLRKRNITFYKDCAVIEITPRWGASLKSEKAKRRVEVHEVWVLDCLRALMHQRELEGWTLDDLLFGSIDQPKVIFRQHFLHRTLLTLLKQVTGETSVTFHALRHSWATRQIDVILSTDSAVDYNRLMHVASVMGHATVGMTLMFYSHRHDKAIFNRMESDAKNRLEVTSKIGEQLTGIPAATLRQRASRSGKVISQLVWDALDAPIPPEILQKLVVKVDVGIPVAPPMKNAISSALTAGKVLRFLEDLSFPGMWKIEEIAARNSIQLEIAERAVKAVIDLANSACNGRIRDGGKTSDVTSVGESLVTLDIVLRAARQFKYASLQSGLTSRTTFPPLVTEGLQAWWDSRVDGYISVGDIKRARVLALMLREIGLGSGGLVLMSCTLKGEAKDPNVRARAAQLLDVLSGVLGSPPCHISDLQQRYGRPHLYLVVPTKKNGVIVTESAALSARGLDAWLLCLKVASDLQLEENNA